jgi:hypothetical protein
VSNYRSAGINNHSGFGCRYGGCDTYLRLSALRKTHERKLHLLWIQDGAPDNGQSQYMHRTKTAARSKADYKYFHWRDQWWALVKN